MTDNISATVMIHVHVTNPQQLWDSAKRAYEKTDLNSNFEELCGSREDPYISDCLCMIFDPGGSPEGVDIQESNAEVDILHNLQRHLTAIAQ